MKSKEEKKAKDGRGKTSPSIGAIEKVDDWDEKGEVVDAPETSEGVTNDGLADYFMAEFLKGDGAGDGDDEPSLGRGIVLDKKGSAPKRVGIFDPEAFDQNSFEWGAIYWINKVREDVSGMESGYVIPDEQFVEMLRPLRKAARVYAEAHGKGKKWVKNTVLSVPKAFANAFDVLSDGDGVSKEHFLKVLTVEGVCALAEGDIDSVHELENYYYRKGIYSPKGGYKVGDFVVVLDEQNEPNAVRRVIAIYSGEDENADDPTLVFWNKKKSGVMERKASLCSKPFPNSGEAHAWLSEQNGGDNEDTKDRTDSDRLDAILESVVLDADPEKSDPEFWAKHDKARHHGHFDPDTMTCKLREEYAKGARLEDLKDELDDIGDGEPDAGATEKKSPQPPKLSKKQQEFVRLMQKKHPDMPIGEIMRNLGEVGKIKDAKLAGDACRWLLKGAVRLPEDMYKVEQARELSGKANKDPFAYNTPQACINALTEGGFKLKAKPITVEELKNNPLMSDYRDEGYGVETFQVDDSQKGQVLMRRIIDTHWGEDANPWCLLARKDSEDEQDEDANERFGEWWGSLTAEEKNRYGETDIFSEDLYDDDLNEYAIWAARDRAEGYYFDNIDKAYDSEEESLRTAWHYWHAVYNGLPKRVAFKDGKLLAFMATDKMDEDQAFDDTAFGGGKLAKMLPDLYDEYEKWQYTEEGQEESANFYQWLNVEHYDELQDVLDNPPEEWWDREDNSSDGIPIGMVEVEGDRLHRKADGELIKGKIAINESKGYSIGEPGKRGYIHWEDPSHIDEMVLDDGTIVRCRFNGRLLEKIILGDGREIDFTDGKTSGVKRNDGVSYGYHNGEVLRITDEMGGALIINGDIDYVTSKSPAHSKNTMYGEETDDEIIKKLWKRYRQAIPEAKKAYQEAEDISSDYYRKVQDRIAELEGESSRLENTESIGKDSADDVGSVVRVQDMVADAIMAAVGQDALDPNDPDFWAKHDRAKHHGHFDPETQSCKLREELGFPTVKNKGERDEAKDREDSEIDDIGGKAPDVSDEEREKKDAVDDIEAGDDVVASPTVTPEEDAAYMDAVRRGDMETAERMVSEVAKRNGYTQEAWHYGDLGLRNEPYYYKPSLPLHAGTRRAAIDRMLNRADSGAYEWAGYKLREENGKWYWQFKSEFYPTEEEADKDMSSGGPYDNKEDAEDAMLADYGGKLTKLFINPQDMVVSEEDDPDISDVPVVKYRNAAEDPGSYSYKIYDVSCVRSAAPVTYDDDGNVIPLSKRFNPEEEDIRYSRSEAEEDEADLGALREASRMYEKAIIGTKVEVHDRKYDPEVDADEGMRESISGIYTGSAADYIKPSLIKVGTGEGSQVYGWGLYGSSVRGVAEGYMLEAISAEDDANTRKEIIQYLSENTNKDRQHIEDLAFALEGSGFDIDKMKSNLVRYRMSRYADPAIVSSMESNIAELSSLGNEFSDFLYDARKHECLYEQTFFTDRKPGDESHLLKWYGGVTSEQLEWIGKQAEEEGFELDASLSDVIERVQNGAIGKNTPYMTGSEVYNSLKIYNSPQAASEFLARAGIDGIKYPVDSYGGKTIKDGDEAGWNYVSFRDDNIRMDHKWVDGKQMFMFGKGGKVVGTYNRETQKIDLYKGATIHTLVHELGGHTTMQVAEQYAQAGNKVFLDKINEAIDNAPKALWEEVRGKYGKGANETSQDYERRLRDEVWAAVCEGRSRAITDAKKDNSGRSWWRRAWNTAKACWAGVMSRMGLQVDYVTNKVKGMGVNEFTDFVVNSIRNGETLGSIKRGGEGIRQSVRESDGESGENGSKGVRRSKTYGVPYQGSKNRIAKDIVSALPDGKRFVDLFSGGGAMTHAAMESGKFKSYRMNDKDGVGQRLFLEGARGDWDGYDRKSMTPEEFAAIKGTPEALAWSFNGLGRNLAMTKKGGRDRAREQIRRVQGLSSLKDQMGKVKASESDYRDVKLRPGDVVYADIPYENTDTRGYRKGMQFNKAEFVDWAQKQDVPVYVSEYTMPTGWTEIASFGVPGMRGGDRTEKLFVQSRFANKGKRRTGSAMDSINDIAADEICKAFGIVEDGGIDPYGPDFWAKHDKAKHGGHFDPETMTCKLREEMGLPTANNKGEREEEDDRHIDQEDDMLGEGPDQKAIEEAEADKVDEIDVDDVEPVEQEEVVEKEAKPEADAEQKLSWFGKVAESFLKGTRVVLRLDKEFGELGETENENLRLSVKDIARLTYKMNEQDVSLKTFAQTFQGYIKQGDTAMEDVERIAGEYLKAVEEHPEEFMAMAEGDKMSHMRYLYAHTGDLFDPDDIRFIGPEDSIPRQVYSLYKDALDEDTFGRMIELLGKGKEITPEEKKELAGIEAEAHRSDDFQSALALNAEKINEERKKKIHDLIQYFEGNDDYTLAEKALIVNGAMRYGISERMTDNGLEVKTVSLGDNNEAQVPVVGGALTAMIVERLRNGDPYKKAIVGAVYDMRNLKATERGVAPDFTGWKVYSKDDSYAAAEELQKAVAGTGWCTGGAVSTAQMHRSGGDFHVWFKDGQPKIAIRTTDGRLAEPPRGTLPGQFCTSEEEEIAEKYIREGHGIVAGDAYFRDMEDIKKVQSGNLSWQDALRIPSERRYENGEFGGDTKAWPKPMKDEIERVIRAHDADRKAAKWFTSAEIMASPELKEQAECIISRDGNPVQIDFNSDKLKEIIGAASIRAGASCPALASIGGNADFYRGASVPALERIGGSAYIGEGASVPALTSVGGDANIDKGASVPALERIDGYASILEGVSVPALASIGGDANISVNVSVPALASIGGYANIYKGVSVPALASVGGDAIIYRGASVPALASIGGGVYIFEGASVPALASIGGEAYIHEGASVPALERIGGEAYIHEGASVPALERIGGNATFYEGASVPALASVGGDAHIRAGASCPALASIGKGADISEGASCPALERIGGAASIRKGASCPALERVGGEAYIHEGASVPALASIGGDANIDKGASVPALERIDGAATIYRDVSCPALASIGKGADIFAGASCPALERIGGDAHIRAGASCPALREVDGKPYQGGDGSIRALRTSSGKVVGTYDRSSNTVTLYKGADVHTLVHEMGGHATMQFAEQCAKLGNSVLMNKINEAIDSAPQALKESVKARYPNASAEVIRDEIWAAVCEGRSREVEAARQSLEGRSWWNRAWRTAKACFSGVLARMGIRNRAPRTLSSMTPQQFTDYIVASMKSGHNIGDMNRPELTRDERKW